MGDGDRLFEFELVAWLSMFGGFKSLSESKAVKFVYVPENLLDIVGAVINESGKATDGFWLSTCCNN